MEPLKSNLGLALAKAQGKMKAAKKDVTNPFFKSKYADLASVWEACRAVLSENELCVIQSPVMQDSVLGIKTKLLHSSGEFEESFLPIAAPITAKAQEMGSAITYARRYSLAAMVGVAPDDDDDGNEATKTGGQPVKVSTQTLQTKATEYVKKIELCENADELNSIIAKNAVLMIDLANGLPEWHKRLKERIEEQKDALGKGG